MGGAGDRILRHSVPGVKIPADKVAVLSLRRWHQPPLGHHLRHPLQIGLQPPDGLRALQQDDPVPGLPAAQHPLAQTSLHALRDGDLPGRTGREVQGIALLPAQHPQRPAAGGKGRLVPRLDQVHQHKARRQRGVAAQIHLKGRRKPANVPALRALFQKGRLRQIVFSGDALHQLRRKGPVCKADSGGIAGKQRIGKGVHQIISHASPSSLCRTETSPQLSVRRLPSGSSTSRRASSSMARASAG